MAQGNVSVPGAGGGGTLHQTSPIPKGIGSPAAVIPFFESYIGVPRHLSTPYLEDRRLEVLRKALELYPDQSARPRLPQLEKLREFTLKTRFPLDIFHKRGST